MSEPKRLTDAERDAMAEHKCVICKGSGWMWMEGMNDKGDFGRQYVPCMKCNTSGDNPLPPKEPSDD